MEIFIGEIKVEELSTASELLPFLMRSQTVPAKEGMGKILSETCLETALNHHQCETYNGTEIWEWPGEWSPRIENRFWSIRLANYTVTCFVEGEYKMVLPRERRAFFAWFCTSCDESDCHSAPMKVKRLCDKAPTSKIARAAHAPALICGVLSSNPSTYVTIALSRPSFFFWIRLRVGLTINETTLVKPDHLLMHCSTSVSMVTKSMAMTLRQGEEGRESRRVRMALITISGLPDLSHVHCPLTSGMVNEELLGNDGGILLFQGREKAVRVDVQVGEVVEERLVHFFIACRRRYRARANTGAQLGVLAESLGEALNA
ncbi:hypothetical protein MAR_009300 [Mya arenaria]|uniref:Uncharacterized protein n=1 Tax=Mya arenaria TaxID=6604 RepID=A0ABY7E1P8_MYAAR|nr:hypothetical protein MAR_009300 [Mya arenaria]